MPNPNENSVAVSIHALIDWVQARLAERESWDGVTLIIFSPSLPPKW